MFVTGTGGMYGLERREAAFPFTNLDLLVKDPPNWGTRRKMGSLS